MADKGTRLLTSATGWFLFGLAGAIGLCLLLMAGAFLFVGGYGFYLGRAISLDEVINLVGTIVILALMVALLWALRKIVLSAEESPFTIENAQRLQRMAWMAFAWQALTLAFAMTGQTINLVSQPGFRIRLVEAFSLSGTGPVLVLALFILAYVFRRGATMQEELDGTV